MGLGNDALPEYMLTLGTAGSSSRAAKGPKAHVFRCQKLAYLLKVELV